MPREKRPLPKLPANRLTTEDVLGHSFHWSDADIAYLTANYEKKTIEELAESLKRTTASVYYKASRLKLTGSRTDWTDREDQILIGILSKNPRETVENLQKKLPKRTRGAIYNRIYKLGLR